MTALLLALLAGARPSAAEQALANARAAALAAESRGVQESMLVLRKRARRIKDEGLRKETLALLREPRFGFFTALRGREEEVLGRLKEEGLASADLTAERLLPPGAYAERAPQPFDAAPGGAYEGGHHAYPGGLAAHTRFNLDMAEAYAERYERQYGRPLESEALDRDVLAAAPIWHDAGKTYVFQWREDGSTLEEAAIAGTGAHHIYGVAEALHRGLPPLLVLAVAAAHAPPDAGGEKALEGFLRAAEILSGKSAQASRSLRSRPEPFINHLADGDWRYTVLAQAEVVKALREIHGERAGFNWLRDEAGSRWTFEALHRALLERGREGLARLLR